MHLRYKSFSSQENIHLIKKSSFIGNYSFISIFIILRGLYSVQCFTLKTVCTRNLYKVNVVPNQLIVKLFMNVEVEVIYQNYYILFSLIFIQF